MKKSRAIIYTIFGVLHVFGFLFSIYIEKHIIDFTFGQLEFLLKGFIWITGLLLLMLITIIIMHLRDNFIHKKEIIRLHFDINNLKANLFDKSEDIKKLKDTPTE